MLSEMSASELGEWQRYFARTPFSHRLLDAEFAALNSTIVSLVGGGAGVSAREFSLLEAPECVPEMDDEMLMAMGEGVAGGQRYGPTDS